jgi:hypothetical protein
MPRLGSPVVPELGAGNSLRNGPVDSIESIRSPFLSGDYPFSVDCHHYSKLTLTLPVVCGPNIPKLVWSIVVRSSVEATIELPAMPTIEPIIPSEHSLLLNWFNCLDGWHVLSC